VPTKAAKWLIRMALAVLMAAPTVQLASPAPDCVAV
jgi:hypothetical protein